MDDTRDKVIALEVKVEEIGKKLDTLTESVDKMSELLAQAKGARWMVGFLLMIVGAAGSYLPSLLRVVFTKV